MLEDTGDDTATTHSQMTKSLATTQHKFSEMEAAIRKHQLALSANKIELALVNERTLTTMSLVQRTSADVLKLQEDTAKQFTKLQFEAEKQAQERRDEFAMMKAMIAALTQSQTFTQNTPPPSASSEDSVHSTCTEGSDNQVDSDTMSTQTMETDNHSSSVAASPAHKKEQTERTR